MTHMIKHFKNIQYLYGNNAYVQIPNDIFRTLSKNIKNKSGNTNIKQTSFAYAYIICVSFLYKYAQFVDINNKTYIQNTDLKQILGYSKTTKSVDYIIKKDGVLEKIGLLKTVKDYPVSVMYGDEYSNFKIREFITLSMMDKSHPTYKIIKNIVKNKNYEVKEPVFMFEYNGGAGSLYDYSNTHRVTIKEFIKLICDEKLDNIDLMLYFFFKSKCYNLNKKNTKSIPLLQITSDIGIGKESFYHHLKIIKDKGMLAVNHKGWISNGRGEPNEYRFIGI